MTATSVVRLGTKAAAEYLGGLPESTLSTGVTGHQSAQLSPWPTHVLRYRDLDAWVEAEAAKTERGGVGE